MISNDARCTREIKSRIAMAKAAFNNKKTLLASKLDLNLSKEPVKCYIWSVALCGAETWTVYFRRKSPRYPLGGPQSRSGHYKRVEDILSLPGIKP
jgi:hypothetical protein